MWKLLFYQVLTDCAMANIDFNRKKIVISGLKIM